MMTANTKAQWKAMVVDTVLKEIRSKTLIFIFIATNLMIFLAHSLLKMLIENKLGTPVVVDGSQSLSFMFRLINIWSVIIAGIFGINSIRSDFHNNIIYQYLSFPISRTQYMFSRILGTWVLVYGYYLYSYVLSTILFSIATHSFVLTWGHLLSMLLMGLYVFLIIFLSFIYSMMVGKIGAFLLLLTTLMAMSFSSNVFQTLSFSEYFKDLSIFKLIGLVVYCLLPRMNYVSEVASNILFKDEIKLNLGLESLHLIVTTAVLIFVANYLVKRKNF